MGDEVVGITALAGTVNEINDNTAAIAAGLESQKAEGKKTIDGVTPANNDISEINDNVAAIAADMDDNGGWFSTTLNQITGHYEKQDKTYGETQALQESMQESLGNLVDFNDVTTKDTKKDKTKKGKTGPSAKLDDLKELPWALGTLGAVLANTIKESSGSKKKGVQGFFSGLMEGVGGIAALGVALLAFAGATLIFNFVDWGSALIGMLSFTAFTVGMVALAKLLGPESKSLKQFAVASMAMAAALGVFAISLVIASNVFAGVATVVGLPGTGTLNIPQIDLVGAAAALVAFGVFEVGMVALAKSMKKSTGDFVNFALGSIAMCGALVAFSVGLVIASNIFANGVNLGPFAKYIGGDVSGVLKIEKAGVLPALGLFLAFELGLAAVARLASNETETFVKFALASIAMCGALVAFSFGLVIVSNLVTNGIHINDLPGGLGPVNFDPVNVFAAIGTVGLFMGFLVAFAVLANFAGTLTGQMALMAGVSVLMSTALIAFSTALIIAGVAAFGGKAELGPLGTLDVPANNGLHGIAAIAIMAGFMAAFAGLGALFLVPFAGAALAAGIAIASTILLGIGATVLIMAKAIALTALVCTPGGTLEWGGKTFTMPSTAITKESVSAAFVPFIAVMDSIVEIGKKIQGEGGLFPWQHKGGVDAGAIRMVGSVAEVVTKVAECIAESMLIKHRVVNEHHAEWNVHVMDGALDYLLTVIEKLATVATSMGIWAAVKMPILTKSMIPIIDAMDKIIDVIEKSLTMPTRLREKGIEVSNDFKIDPKILNSICDPVMQVLLGPNMDGKGGLAGAADNLGIFGAIALEKVTAAMLPVAQTISTLVDCIEKAATLGGKDTSATDLIKKGVDNMKSLMVGDGAVDTSGAFWWKKTRVTNGFVGIFNIIADGLAGISEEAKQSCEAMAPLAQTVVTLVDNITKIGEQTDAINSASKTIAALSNFIGGKGGAKIRGTFWYFLEDINSYDVKDYQEWQKDLQELNKVVAETSAFISTLTNGNVINGFSKLGTIGDLSGFAKAMDKFNDGCKYLSKAYDRVKDIPDKWINTFSVSFAEIDNANLDNLDKMAMFSDKAKALGDTASNIERIAKAMRQVNKENSSGGLAGAAEKLGGVVTDFLGRFGKGDSPAEQSGSASAAAKPVTIQKGQELQGIAQILSKWDQSGIKILGQTADKQAVKTITV